jgi:hypothetical protein
MPRSPRVFVSYCHESRLHQDRVEALAARLVTEGVDANIDRWFVDPPGGWPLWMEQQILMSDFTLLVCTEQYKYRVESLDEQPSGAGVFWEANLIRNRLYNSKGADTSFIPVFFGSFSIDFIPNALQGKTRYQIDDPDAYNGLYRRLTNQPASTKPERGEIIVLPRISASTEVAKEATLLTAHEVILPQVTQFNILSPVIDREERDLRSIEGRISTYIRFDNYLPEPVNLYWINYEGTRVYYAAVAPGRSHLQQTYVTHPWVVTKADVYSLGRPVVIFEPMEESGIATIGP